MTSRGKAPDRVIPSHKSMSNSALTALYRSGSYANTTSMIADNATTEATAHQNYTKEFVNTKSISSAGVSLHGQFNSSTTRQPFGPDFNKPGPGVLIEVVTPPNQHNHPGAEEALLNRSSVLFVAVSFVLLMVISLAWLVFYYVQRFRYLHSKERVSRRLAELAKKAVARIPVKTLHPGDKETLSDTDQCAICIEPYRPMDQLRILPCRHYFHKLCIDPWLLEQRSCPMCKLDILQAYGLRTDFYFNIPGGDVSSGLPGHVNLLGTVRSGITSASGSDDGMERIALVHSGSLTTGPSPSLAYVVLSTTSTDFTPINRPSHDVTPETSGLYFAHHSTADPRIQSPLVQQHFAGPISPLTNQVVVPVLPALAAMPSQASHEGTSGFIMWNREVGPAALLGPCTTVVTSGTAHFPSSSISNITGFNQSSEQLNSTALTLQHSTCGVHWPPRMSESSARSKVSEVTSTTQAFTGPVCSVIVEFDGHDIPSMDSCKGSPVLEESNIQGAPLAPRLAVEEPSPPSVDSTGSVHCVAKHSSDLGYSECVSPTSAVVSSNYPQTLSDELLCSRSSSKARFRRSRSRQKLHLPAVISGINRLPFASWFNTSWLPHLPGRSTGRDSLPMSDTHVFQPTMQASSSTIPSDPLLEQDALSFHPPLSTGPQPKRGATERIVVAVVETPPDRLRNCSSTDSNSGDGNQTNDCAVDDNLRTE